MNDKCWIPSVWEDMVDFQAGPGWSPGGVDLVESKDGRGWQVNDCCGSTYIPRCAVCTVFIFYFGLLRPNENVAINRCFTCTGEPVITFAIFACFQPNLITEGISADTFRGLT